MALSDWRAATATAATSATHEPANGPTVAIVATVAVAGASKGAFRLDPATSEQADELRELVALVAAEWPEAERAEALAVAFADPYDALTCWRALAEEHSGQYARAREIRRPSHGPYTTLTIAGRDSSDDRRTCNDCANLSAGEKRCLAAWRGEGPYGAGRTYTPMADALKRCTAYAPRADDPDQRPGRERWSSVVDHEKRHQEAARRAREGGQ